MIPFPHVVTFSLFMGRLFGLPTRLSYVILLCAQASPAVSVPGSGGAGGQSPDDHRYADMMSLQLPSSLELGSSLRGALPSDLDLNAADQHVR